MIQRSFDDNKGDEKKLKGQEHLMITKMMISRIKDEFKIESRTLQSSKRKFDFKNQESSFKIQVPRIKIKIQDSRIKNQKKT